MLETWVPSLGWEDPLEKEMAYPLQYPCLENSMDRGAWWATSLWGHKELVTTKRLHFSLCFLNLLALFPILFHNEARASDSL